MISKFRNGFGLGIRKADSDAILVMLVSMSIYDGS